MVLSKGNEHYALGFANISVVGGSNYTGEVFVMENTKATPSSVDVIRSEFMLKITMQNKSLFKIIDEGTV